MHRWPAAVALPALLLLAASTERPAEERPRPSGGVEQTTVTLMLLDVLAVDRRGRPMPGLSKEDFVLLLGGRERPIYSVDDLCACGPEEARVGTAGADGPQAGDTSAAVAGGAKAAAGSAQPAAERPLTVLYLDFSQLDASGRLTAGREARRWVSEIMRPGDRVMVEGYASSTGLREICPPTSDRALLDASLMKAAADRSLIDTFPDSLEDRAEECEAFPTRCEALAQEEIQHGRASMRAMRGFLAGLEEVPGPKALFLFNANGMMSPSKIFHARPETHLGEIEQVAADAVQSRTAVYTVNVAPLATINDRARTVRAEQAVAFGLNLADFTGGGYNRGAFDLQRVLPEAGRGCRCLYRIGIRPPDEEASRIYKVSVSVRGRRLPNQYRVQFLNEAARWMRKAQTVLARPETARDLEIATLLHPVAQRERRWTIEAEVQLHTDALALLPGAEGRSGAWEVGALLHDAGGSRRWEMLGSFKVRRGAEGESDATVVHRRRFDDLKPGRYRLTAFVRDRTLNLFGARDSWVDLVDPDKGGAVGPLILRPGLKERVVPLPLQGEESGASAPAAELEEGSVAGALRPAAPGDPIEVETWICSPKEQPPPARLASYITEGGVPIFRLPASERAAEGECDRVVERIETGSLSAGEYGYHLRWRRGASEDEEAVAFFTIAGAPPRAHDAPPNR